MKKEMSSFDVRSIVTEISGIEGAHMDKIFHWGAKNVLFRLNVQGEGKRELFFKDGKWLYSPSVKPETPTMPTSFASFLRKYIDNARVGKVRQIGFDRAIELELAKSDGDYKLVFEMFGGGNVLLIKDGVILNCLIQKTWKDRSVRPGSEYVVPKSRFDPTGSSEEEFVAAFRSSDSDAVRTLATSANLGGQYAEEVCKRIGIDKSTPAKDVEDGQISKMYEAMKGIMGYAMESPEPTAYLKDGKIEDFAPMKLESRSDLESRSYPTMSAMIHDFMLQIADEEEEAYVDPEIEKLRRRIAKQEETIAEYTEAESELRRKAESIYTDYQKTSELLAVLSEQSKKLPWDKLEAGAMRIPFVESIDPSKNRVVAKLGDESVELDYTKGIDANASDLYQKAKDISDKAGGAKEALEESKTILARAQKHIDKAKAAAAGKAEPTKQFWFERYKWLITPGGKLVIAGRDTHTNDAIVKKHLKENDVYAHADVHGAPSVILKDGASASEEDLRCTCHFAIAQSKAWVAAVAEGSAFWVYPDQVSKTPNPGEFVPRGAFIIRGKRNYEYHLPMTLTIGEVYYQGARKVMCGPSECFAGCGKYVEIVPGRGKTGRRSNEIAKMFDVPEEEVSRILPPGDVEISKEVFPKDAPEEE
ncbi:MAG: NFACT family protein [Candidatus Methanomethylophilaceae archaeon]|nr:NFACT family protein [Candidatus Methanomethylophilaceae archaeon]